MLAYGDKRDYPKIDIYGKGKDGEVVYLCSTTWAKTCKEAVARYNEHSTKQLASHAYFAN